MDTVTVQLYLILNIIIQITKLQIQNVTHNATQQSCRNNFDVSKACHSMNPQFNTAADFLDLVFSSIPYLTRMCIDTRYTAWTGAWPRSVRYAKKFSNIYIEIYIASVANRSLCTKLHSLHSFCNKKELTNEMHFLLLRIQETGYPRTEYDDPLV